MKDIKVLVGDIVEMKKNHACGSNKWQVERTGYDIWLRCLNCKRLVKLQRPDFNKKYKRL